MVGGESAFAAADGLVVRNQNLLLPTLRIILNSNIKQTNTRKAARKLRKGTLFIARQSGVWGWLVWDRLIKIDRSITNKSHNSSIDPIPQKQTVCR